MSDLKRNITILSLEAKKARILNGYGSVQMLSEKLGINSNMIFNIEKGSYLLRKISKHQYEKLSKIYGKETLDKLIGGTR